MDSICNELSAKVMNQLEYYFSDINLRTDYFMKGMTLKDNGWISIEALIRFNRLKQLVNNNKDFLINVLKNTKSDLIELNVNEDKVRRKVDKPLPQMSDQLAKHMNEKTVHIKGFPKDATLDQLIQWSEQFGSVLSVEMRRLKTSHCFKGCVFVTFVDKSIVDKVVNESVLKFADKELFKESKLQYIERNLKFKAERKRLRDENRLLAQMLDKVSVKDKPELIGDNQLTQPIGTESAVLKLNGLPRSVASNRIKKYLNLLAKVLFVQNHPKGYSFVRFAQPFDALKVLAILAKSQVSDIDSEPIEVKIAGKTATAQVLSGEDEKHFWIESNNRILNKEKQKRLKKLKNTTRKRTISCPNFTTKPKRMSPNK